MPVIKTSSFTAIDTLDLDNIICDTKINSNSEWTFIPVQYKYNDGSVSELKFLMDYCNIMHLAAKYKRLYKTLNNDNNKRVTKHFIKSIIFNLELSPEYLEFFDRLEDILRSSATSYINEADSKQISKTEKKNILDSDSDSDMDMDKLEKKFKTNLKEITNSTDFFDSDSSDSLDSSDDDNCFKNKNKGPQISIDRNNFMVNTKSKCYVHAPKKIQDKSGEVDCTNLDSAYLLIREVFGLKYKRTDKSKINPQAKLIVKPVLFVRCIDNIRHIYIRYITESIEIKYNVTKSLSVIDNNIVVVSKCVDDTYLEI